VSRCSSAVITEAGLHERVAALVYIAAFAPDKGESVNTLIAGFPAGGPQPPILPPKDGFLFLDRDKFPASFAGDLTAGQAAFMADSQVPWGVNALGGTISEAAWLIKPSWYLVAGDDRMIPPPAQRAMSERADSTMTENPGRLPEPAGTGDMVRVSIDGHPLTATAALVWNGDLPRRSSRSSSTPPTA
jgi:hypothetical protein